MAPGTYGAVLGPSPPASVDAEKKSGRTAFALFTPPSSPMTEAALGLNADDASRWPSTHSTTSWLWAGSIAGPGDGSEEDAFGVSDCAAAPASSDGAGDDSSLDKPGATAPSSTHAASKHPTPAANISPGQTKIRPMTHEERAQSHERVRRTFYADLPKATTAITNQLMKETASMNGYCWHRVHTSLKCPFDYKKNAVDNSARTMFLRKKGERCNDLERQELARLNNTYGIKICSAGCTALRPANPSPALSMMLRRRNHIVRCDQVKKETEILPQGVLMGWDEPVHWEDVVRCAEGMRTELMVLAHAELPDDVLDMDLESVDACHESSPLMRCFAVRAWLYEQQRAKALWHVQAARAEAEGKPRPPKGTLDPPELKLFGRYGSPGLQLVRHVIDRMVPLSWREALALRLSVWQTMDCFTLTERILGPHVFLRLYMTEQPERDMYRSWLALQESSAYGWARFDDTEDYSEPEFDRIQSEEGLLSGYRRNRCEVLGEVVYMHQSLL
ncbi:hypothetical protein BD626DRAFT_574254 [Schizophyllum amplum]|nr:hypothetical protein BD626DRAFT_574254 [Auriculariopsis ampla]